MRNDRFHSATIIGARRCAAALMFVSVLAGCSTDSPKPVVGAVGAGTVSAGAVGVARLEAKSGSSVAGSVTFTQQGDRIVVAARLSGLKPNQEHGFHVHEKGDCSSPDGMSAGGHFNPTGNPHGPQNMPHHGGDMPSLRADAAGNVDLSFLITGVSLDAGDKGLLGKGVIVHANPDDYMTQPTGNAGGRLACGVIAMR